MSAAPANQAQVTDAIRDCITLVENTIEDGSEHEHGDRELVRKAFAELAAIGAGEQAVADSLWVPAKPEHKKIGWTYDFDQTERLSRAAEKATGYEGTMEVIEFVMAEADRRHKSALSQTHPADERSASDVICEECGHLVSPREATWTEDGSPFHAKCLPAEAENARLRALPLKDEVERELRKAHGETMGEAGNALLDKSVDGRIKANWLGGKANGLGVALDVLSRLRAGEREGWKLVPVETTRAMRDAGFKILSELDDADPTQVMDVRPSAVWEAMLAAAPKQGEANAEGEES